MRANPREIPEASPNRCDLASRGMTIGEDEVDGGGHLTEEEHSWLDALATGRSVLEVAVSTGHSERDMYLRLNDIYVRLGVSGRSRALAEAARRDRLWTKDGSDGRERRSNAKPDPDR